MRALTVIPGRAGSARIDDVAEPDVREGAVLLETLAVGVCGTDLEIVAGAYGWAPQGKARLVLGHEALGRVLEAPPRSGFKAGDLAVGIVRHPDPVPCPNCRVGEWDMCRNGRYTERGIKEIDGFCRERFRAEPAFLVPVPSRLGLHAVLTEPASVLAKAWDHIERIGERATWRPRRCLVTGAGPIGLLAALMGRQRGLEVDVVDRVTSGPKPELVGAIGANYHTGPIAALAKAADVVVECTGVGQLVFDILQHVPPDAITCLTGISSGGRPVQADFSVLNKTMVLENGVLFGSVNANARHYEAAVAALAEADPDWLGRVVSRKVPLEDWEDALKRRPDDVKPVIQLREV
jgi:threonine dehydrogenase-like Zn-dependent dehydrogenase